MKKKKQNMDTDNFIVYIKTEDIYVDIGIDVQTRFDTSIYKEGLLPREKNKKVVGLMKKELEENLSRKQSKPSGKKKI